MREFESNTLPTWSRRVDELHARIEKQVNPPSPAQQRYEFLKAAFGSLMCGLLLLGIFLIVFGIPE